MSRRITAAAPEEALPQVGDVLAGKYRVERMLGAGGMGVVFEVTHVITHKRFAIKWMLRDGIEDDSSVRRFIREAMIASRIDHPHVVQVYDVHQDHTGVFQLMELLEGTSLAELLCRHGRLAPREAIRVMLASMEGLIAAHAAGVVHRDIKPANIFLCKARPGQLPQPKVLDFGISRLINVQATLGDATTESGTMLGTPYYMAPEQMLPGPVDARVDVYALGVTLYELIAGQRPYEGATYAELVMNIAAGKAIPLDRVAPDLPAGLAALVARAMHSVASKRFESVEACRQELQRFAIDSGSPTQPLQRPRSARRTRSSTLWRSAFAVILAAMVGASATWWSLRREKPPVSVEHHSYPRPRATDMRAEERGGHAVQAAAPSLEAAPPAQQAAPAGLDAPPIAEVERQEQSAANPQTPQPSAARTKSVRPIRRPVRVEKPKADEAVPTEPEPATKPTGRPQRPTLDLSRDGF